MPTLTNNLTSIKHPPSLKERVYEIVKEAITVKKFLPGQYYSVVKLADELGVSRTPVREALIELSSVGFLTVTPAKGFRINAWNKRKIKELYSFRKIIEIAVIKKVTPRVEEAFIEELKSIESKERRFLIDQDIRSHQLADRSIHLVLAKKTDNIYLYNAIKGIRDLIEWIGYEIVSSRHEVMEDFSDDHKRLIEALANKNMSLAEIIMKDHINNGEREALRIVK